MKPTAATSEAPKENSIAGIAGGPTARGNGGACQVIGGTLTYDDPAPILPVILVHHSDISHSVSIECKQYVLGIVLDSRSSAGGQIRD